MRGRKIAAGVVYKKHLITTGVNSYKTHPMMLQYGKNKESIYLHAEVDAIKNAIKMLPSLSKCDLYVVRLKKTLDGKYEYGLAKPCIGCARAIATFDIRNVYYTEDNNVPSW